MASSTIYRRNRRDCHAVRAVDEANLGRAGTWLKALVTVPFVLPTVVVGGAFKELFERIHESLALPNLNQTAAAIIVAHAFFNFAVVARTVSAYWSGLDHQLEEQARTLGDSNRRVFWQVTWPRLKPAIFRSRRDHLLLFVHFVRSSAGARRAQASDHRNRDLPSRSSPRRPTNEFFVGADPDSSGAVSRSCDITFGATREYQHSNDSQHYRPNVASNQNQCCLIHRALPWEPVSDHDRTVVARRGSLRVQNYRALFEKVPQLPTTSIEALGNSVVYGLLATALALGIGLLCSMAIVSNTNATGRVLDIAATLPLGVSAVTVGLGILITLNRPPIDWRTSWWIVPVAHALVAVPFVVRSIVPMLRQIHPSIREAAALLGSSQFRIRREIDLLSLPEVLLLLRVLRSRSR